MSRRPGERLKTAVMPKGFNGFGVVRVQCSEGAFTALKLENMPPPSDYGEVINGRRYVRMETRALGADSERYRVIWADRSNGPSSKHRTSSFTLAGRHSNETLFVLAEFLRTQGVEFVALANKHGNAFKSAALQGTRLAYLSADGMHAHLAGRDLLFKPAPEDSSPSGL